MILRRVICQIATELSLFTENMRSIYSPKLSVGIPTLNRAERVIRALNSLQLQSFREFEVLVCDNSRDGNLKSLIEQYTEDSAIFIKYLSQPTGGLTEARSRIVVSAKAEIIVFMDDDETASPDLLYLYYKYFLEYPEMIGACGPYELDWEITPPDWIASYVGDRKNINAWGSFHLSEQFEYGSHVWGWGGNVAFKKKIFEFTGFRPEVIGGRQLGDGESGLFAELCSNGYKLGYIPEAKIFHHMPPSRMTVKYFRESSAYLGVTRAYRRWHNQKRSAWKYIGELVKLIKLYHKSWIKYFYARYGPDSLSRKCLDDQYAAHMGFFQVYYMWRLIFDPLLRKYIDVIDFRPESILAMAEDLQ